MANANDLLRDELKALLPSIPETITSRQAEEVKERYEELLSSLVALLLSDEVAQGNLLGIVLGNLSSILSNLLSLSEEAISVLSSDVKQITPPAKDGSFDRAETALERMLQQASDGGDISSDDIEEVVGNLSSFAARQLVPVDSSTSRQEYIDGLTGIIEEMDSLLLKAHDIISRVVPGSLFLSGLKQTVLKQGALIKTIERVQKTFEFQKEILSSEDALERITKSSKMLAQVAAVGSLFQLLDIDTEKVRFSVHRGNAKLLPPESSGSQARVYGSPKIEREDVSGQIVNIPPSSNTISVTTESGSDTIPLPYSTSPAVQLPIGSLPLEPSITVYFYGSVYQTSSDTQVEFTFSVPIVETVDTVPATSSGTGRYVYELSTGDYYRDDPGGWVLVTSTTIGPAEVNTVLQSNTYNVQSPSFAVISDIASTSVVGGNIEFSASSTSYRTWGDGVRFTAELSHSTNSASVSDSGSSPTLQSIASSINSSPVVESSIVGGDLEISSTVIGVSGDLRSFVEVTSQPQHLSSPVLGLPSSRSWGSTDSIDPLEDAEVGDLVISSAGTHTIISVLETKTVISPELEVSQPAVDLIWGSRAAYSYFELMTVSQEFSSGVSGLLSDTAQLQEMVGESVYDPSLRPKIIQYLRNNIGDTANPVPGPASNLISALKKYSFDRSGALSAMIEALRSYGFDKALELLRSGDIESLLTSQNASYSISMREKFSKLGLNINL